MTESNKQLPWIVRRWLYVTSAIVVFDAAFILLRPWSLPGGCLEMLFHPYRWYFAVDRLYADMKDSFVYAQAIANCLEVLLNIICLYYNQRNTRKTIVLAFAVNVMTFWKTVIYFLVFWNMEFRKENTFLQEFFLIYCTNGVWLVMPFFCIMVLWNHLCQDSTSVHHYSTVSMQPRHSKPVENNIRTPSPTKQQRFDNEDSPARNLRSSTTTKRPKQI